MAVERSFEIAVYSIEVENDVLGILLFSDIYNARSAKIEERSFLV
jgi:hypothetical protein